MGLTNRVRVLEFDLAKKRATIQKTRLLYFCLRLPFFGCCVNSHNNV
jgi:hypothetical protein